MSAATPASAPPRIQFLEPGEIENEFGCVGAPVGSSDAVLGWSSALVVMKIDGALLRFEPQKTSQFQTGDERPGDRIRQEWRSGSISAFFDLVRTGREESHWEGDLTVRTRNGTEVGSPKAIRIRIDCGC
jgi:hypothetical protein